MFSRPTTKATEARCLQHELANSASHLHYNSRSKTALSHRVQVLVPHERRSVPGNWCQYYVCDYANSVLYGNSQYKSQLTQMDLRSVDKLWMTHCAECLQSKIIALEVIDVVAVSLVNE